MVLRADGAIRADDLHASLAQKRPGIPGPRAAECGAFLGIGHLGDDGQLRKRTNRFDCRHELVGIAECLQDEKIHAAFFERLGLLAKNFPEMFGCGFANLPDDAERPDRPGDQDFMLGGFARFAGDLHAAMIEFGDAVFQAKCAQVYCGWRQMYWFQ